MAKRVLRYLKGTIDYGLVYRVSSSTPHVKIEAYADADFAACKATRRSVTGYCLQVDGNTFLYRSRGQTITVDDTSSAEFVAASQCSTDIVWVINLCKELGIKREPVILYQDNQATIAAMTNTGKIYKIRGVDIRYHKVKDLVEHKYFGVTYCPTTDMVADVLTKALRGSQFVKLRASLNVAKLPETKVQKNKRRVHFQLPEPDTKRHKLDSTPERLRSGGV